MEEEDDGAWAQEGRDPCQSHEDSQWGAGGLSRGSELRQGGVNARRVGRGLGVQRGRSGCSELGRDGSSVRGSRVAEAMGTPCGEPLRGPVRKALTGGSCFLRAVTQVTCRLQEAPGPLQLWERPPDSSWEYLGTEVTLGSRLTLVLAAKVREGRRNVWSRGQARPPRVGEEPAAPPLPAQTRPGSGCWALGGLGMAAEQLGWPCPGHGVGPPGPLHRSQWAGSWVSLWACV